MSVRTFVLTPALLLNLFFCVSSQAFKLSRRPELVVNGEEHVQVHHIKKLTVVKENNSEIKA